MISKLTNKQKHTYLILKGWTKLSNPVKTRQPWTHPDINAACNCPPFKSITFSMPEAICITASNYRSDMFYTDEELGNVCPLSRKLKHVHNEC